MNNSTFNNQTQYIDDYFIPNYSPPILRATLLFLLMVSGLVCNIMVIVVIVKNRHLRKSINYFILSMAISDLFIPLFSISVSFENSVVGSGAWIVGGILGDFLCKFVYFFSDLSPLISNLSLVFMSLDRFIAIVYPTKFNLRTPTFRKRLIILSWLIPIIYCSKNFYSHKVVYSEYCGEIWFPDLPQAKTNTEFMTFYTVTFVYIPFILLTVMYSVIICTLRKQQIVHENNIPCRFQQKVRQKQRRRVISLSLAIVLAFMICYGPINYSYMMQSFVFRWVNDGTIGLISHEMTFFGLVLSFSNSTINPLICMAFHKDMRICVAKMLACNRLRCFGTNKTFKLKKSFHLQTLEVDKATTVTTSSIKNLSDIRLDAISLEETKH